MPSTPQLIDVQVGSRMRFRRVELRLSQKEVADGLEVSFQQVQKYEKGSNRIAASRLVVLSNLLGVTPAYFFDEGAGQGSVEDAKAVIDLVASASSEDCVRLNRAFRRIADPSLRATVVALIEAIGGRPEAAGADT